MTQTDIAPGRDLTTAPAPAPLGPDPRLTALRRFAVSITVFNVVGHAVLGFEQSPVTPVATALVAWSLEILLEAVAARSRGERPRYLGSGFGGLVTFLLPAHIAAMATAMLLWGGPSLWPYLFAVSVAITVKHVVKAPVRGRWRHTMNPSNTGIAVTLVLFAWVGIAPPYMFTAAVTQPVDGLVPLGILALGTMLNLRLTGKMPLIAAWVGGFVAQAVVRSVLLGENLLASLAPMTGVAFVLFTNYMITDPGSTPTGRRGQVAFGLACAAVYGVLVASGVTFGLFFALVITCLGRTVGLLGLSLSRRVARSRTRAVAAGPDLVTA